MLWFNPLFFALHCSGCYAKSVQDSIYPSGMPKCSVIEYIYSTVLSELYIERGAKGIKFQNIFPPENIAFTRLPF